MKLLFRRKQARRPNGKIQFRLWSKIDLSTDENMALSKYNLDQACLIVEDQPNLLRNAIGVFAVCFLVVMTLLFRQVSFLPATGLAIGLSGAAAWFYFDRFRETIYVKDLMHGRFFACGSVVELVRKEAWLQQVVSFLRQVMETSKYWDGQEPIDIPAYDKETARQIVLKGM